MRQRRAVAIVSTIGLAAVLAGCGDDASGDDSAPPEPCAPANLIWVYSRYLDSGPSYPTAVFRLHEGSETRLTDDDAGEDAAMAPDGSRVVFQRGSEGDPESAGYTRRRLYVMGSDGTDQRPLLDPVYEVPVTPDTLVAWDTRPIWSPDGTTIAFTRQATFLDPASPDRFQGIMVVPAAGGQPRQIAGDNKIREASVGWSADSSRLAWTTLQPNTLRWATRQGRELGRLELPGASGAPAWTDGDRQILVPYQLGVYGPNPEHGVYQVDFDSGEHTKIPLEDAWIEDLWTLPTGEIVGVETLRDDQANETGGRVVVMDPERPEDGEVIANFETELNGLVTAVPDDPDGWAACTEA